MSEINTVGIIKGVAEFAASAGAGIVVGNLIKATTPDDVTRFQKVLVGIGAYTIGGVLSSLSGKYIANEIQGVADKIEALRHPKSQLDVEELSPEETQEVLEQVQKELKKKD